jgi:hypothetical protein
MRLTSCLYFVIFLSILSCHNSTQVSVENALNEAGSNREQLQKVLDYYSQPHDTLKLKAAVFLIRNLPFHYGYYGGKIKNYTAAFSAIDTLYYKNTNIPEWTKNSILDSVMKIHGTNDHLPVIINDSKKISASYLINNIEYAFKAWKRAPWSNKVSFNSFCEYILPYRFRDEQIQLWRPGFYKNYDILRKQSSNPNDANAVFDYLKTTTENSTNLSGYFGTTYPFTQNINDASKGRTGSCEAISFLSASVLRSIGLPVALDYIPHWGNNNNSNHHLVKLIKDNKKPIALFSNTNEPVNTWGIVDFSSDYNRDRHNFTDDEIPKGMYVQYIKTIPKVYRHTFSSDPVFRDINDEVPSTYLNPLFRQSTFKDVTDEYMKCTTRLLTVPARFKKYKAVHLCVFDVTGWQATAVASIDQNSAFFDKLGSYVVYLPAVYDDGNYLPVDAPFYLDSLNIIHELKQSDSKKKEIKLIRKSPLYSYTAYHTELLKGGSFEGSNTADFSNSTLLYHIDNYPFYMNEIKVNCKEQFRYLRYVAPKGSYYEADNIAEVQFYEEGQSKPLTGSFIGKEGTYMNPIRYAFDNNLNTYYESASYTNSWIGIDLGQQPKRVSTIKFCPKNDTNCIIPENEYELAYWDDKWISLGSQKARDYSLLYKNAPTGALFWLKCKSGGKEERIFTFKNGKQIWW